MVSSKSSPYPQIKRPNHAHLCHWRLELSSLPSPSCSAPLRTTFSPASVSAATAISGPAQQLEQDRGSDNGNANVLSGRLNRGVSSVGVVWCTSLWEQHSQIASPFILKPAQNRSIYKQKDLCSKDTP
uniref:Uncharacterized protein n=1 Tax=Arundo donax TaxID=35708 RepID=A0A0A9BTI4_ARUDO